ncbi:MAG TPA: hypothetical protein VFN49_07380, partial [Candidatus Aquilonibacter sp.]|nr:hypothetical protein [Candidatus Aquilonibacter sp.]
MIELAACVALHAFTPALAEQAAREGAAMADAHDAYGVRPWLIYQSKDPLRAVHGKAGVDAIVIETPYERVRYYAYLHRLQGDSLSHALEMQLYEQARDRLGFVVYAHSKAATDQHFLSHFSRALLTSPSGIARSGRRAIFGPSSDFYDVGTFREQRWVGSL